MQSKFFLGIFLVIFVFYQSTVLFAQVPSAKAPLVLSYQIQPGDTWQNLQQRFLASQYTWQDLRDFNRLPLGFPLIPQQTIFLPQAWLKQQSASLKITEVRGINYWQRGEKKYLALPDEALVAGDTIFVSTEASVSLGFPDGSQLLLKGPAELAIQALRQQVGSGALEVELRLASGEIESQVQTSNPLPTKVKIITLQGEVIINGTRFVLSVTPEKSQLAVEQGQVRLKNPQGEVLVQQGFGSQMTADAPPLPPRALPPAPSLPGKLNNIEKFPFQTEFVAVAEAKAYEITIAQDSAFQKIVFQEESLRAILHIPYLEDGRYWLRLKSIDALGFKSIGALSPLIVKAQLQAPRLLTPKEGEMITNQAITFSWQSDAPVFLLEILSENKPLASKKHYLHDKTLTLNLETADLYFWRVIPMTEQEYAGESSAWQSFRYQTNTR